MHTEFLRENLLEKSMWKTEKEMEDNIKIDLREMDFEEQGWIKLSQGCVRCRALVLSVLNLQVCYHSDDS
jgi:hypothetical protein